MWSSVNAMTFVSMALLYNGQIIIFNVSIFFFVEQSKHTYISEFVWIIWNCITFFISTFFGAISMLLFIFIKKRSTYILWFNNIIHKSQSHITVWINKLNFRKKSSEKNMIFFRWVVNYYNSPVVQKSILNALFVDFFVNFTK